MDIVIKKHFKIKKMKVDPPDLLDTGEYRKQCVSIYIFVCACTMFQFTDTTL